MNMSMWIEPDDDAKPKASKTSSGHTKPLTRKTFKVEVGGVKDLQHFVAEVWRLVGNHSDRARPDDQKRVLNIGVLDGRVVMTVDYLVRGGFPDDIRRWLHNMTGVPKDSVKAERIGMVHLPEPEAILTCDCKLCAS